jgi:hypothetical protein
MHTVDRHELFGQRIRRRVVFGRRTGDAGQDVVILQSAQNVLRVAQKATPVGAESG